MSDNANAGIVMNSEEIVLVDRTVYYYEDSYLDTRGASFLMKDQFIDVKGNIDKDIIINIVSNIQINN